MHVRIKSLARRFNGYVERTSTREAFQTNDTYVPPSIRTGYVFAHATTALDRPRAEVECDIEVQTMYKYLFANINAKSEDGIYPVTVSEIAEAQMEHRIFRKYFSKKAFKNRDKHIRSVVIN